MGASNFVPTKSKELFVGREDELKVFAKVLDRKVSEWILHLPGDGGMGKTRLLEEMCKAVQGNDAWFVTADLVDFYQGATHSMLGLMQALADQLGAEHFEDFRDARKDHEQLLQAGADRSVIQDRENDVTSAFLKGYERLIRRGKRLLLLFDTCEEMGVIQSRIMEELLPALRQVEEAYQLEIAQYNAQPIPEFRMRSTVIAFAGRTRLNFGELGRDVITIDLGPLDEQAITQFFREGELGEDVVNRRDIVEISKLTAGLPLYVALCYDWLKNGVGTTAELLTLNKPFGENLISWVARLEQSRMQAIMLMGIAWRRMDLDLLAALMEISQERARAIIQELGQFSFVRYRETDRGLVRFQLHDEMRRLVRDYRWPKQTFMRESLLQNIVAWYEQRLDDRIRSGEQPPADDDQRALLAEWVFYRCELDLNSGLDLLDPLFRKTVHRLDLDLSRMLNEELGRFYDKGLLSRAQQDTLAFRRALVAFRREDYEEAKTLWQALVRLPDMDPRLKAASYTQLTELFSYAGDPDDAITFAREGEALYTQLIKEDKQSEARETLQAELGQLYNNWGYAYRVKGDWASAIDYYERALESAPLDNPRWKKNAARTLNNLGYVHFQRGDLVKASTYVGKALQMRQHLRIPYELGLGHNTMGILKEETGRMAQAADRYQEAELNFAAAGSRRGLAMVYLNLGRLNRRINNYDTALEYLNKARRIFESFNDADNLVSVLNELGCVYRQRGDEGDREKAEGLFKQAIARSEDFPVKEMDNWEDLSILYMECAVDALRVNDTQAAQVFIEKIGEPLRKAQEMASAYGNKYILAKTHVTAGELAYNQLQYPRAFDEYFEAVNLIAEAKADQRNAVAMQNRYEEMADRLQKRLQEMPDEQDTYEEAIRLLKKLDKLEPEHRAEMATIEQMLEATTALIDRYRGAGVS